MTNCSYQLESFTPETSYFCAIYLHAPIYSGTVIVSKHNGILKEMCPKNFPNIFRKHNVCKIQMKQSMNTLETFLKDICFLNNCSLFHVVCAENMHGTNYEQLFVSIYFWMPIPFKPYQNTSGCDSEYIIYNIYYIHMYIYSYKYIYINTFYNQIYINLYILFVYIFIYIIYIYYIYIYTKFFFKPFA